MKERNRKNFRQHRTIPALRLKYRFGGSPRQEPPQAAVALRSASLRLGVRHGICVAKMLDNTQSIICAFGLAAAAPRSPYRHLELCGIAFKQIKQQNAPAWGWFKTNLGRGVFYFFLPNNSLRIYAKHASSPSSRRISRQVSSCFLVSGCRM